MSFSNILVDCQALYIVPVLNMAESHGQVENNLRGYCMSRKHGLFTVLVIATMLVAACGPEMATPTPADESVVESSAPTEAPAAETPKSEPTSSDEEPAAAGELPVDADDWHVLGSPDAPVTIIEYSDFQ